MKIAPVLPGPAVLVKDPLKVEALTDLRPVQPQARHETPDEAVGEEEERHEPRVQGERRIYCRRIEYVPVLIELRSGKDRRRHNQRAGDPMEHVDVNA